MRPPRTTSAVRSQFASTLVDDSAPDLALLLWQANERWRAGEAPDARELFREHPQVEHNKSFALDAIYDEYRLRRGRGEDVTQQQMLERYPRYRSSLARLFAVHEVVAGGTTELESERLLGVFGFSAVEQLGRGAFSDVFLARDSTLGDRLAVVKLGQRTADEARLWGRLNHPHIVPLLSYHHDPRYATSGVAMPFLGRATLCDLLDARFGEPGARPSLDELAERVARANQGSSFAATPRQSRSYEDLVIRIGLALASALHYTHTHGVLHLDLKPSNVLLPSLEVPLLMDFNLSADRTGESTAVLGGTMAYIAPEQLQALLNGSAAATIDGRADLYALGALLYELVTGEAPFPDHEAGPLRRVGEQHRRLQAAGAPGLRGVSRTLARLVAQCLEFDPQARPASAGEVANRLRSELSAWRVLARAARRHPRRIAAACLVGVALSATGAALVAARPSPVERSRRAAEHALQGADYSLAVEHLNDALRAAPDDHELRLARAHALLRMGEFVPAEMDYSAVRRAAPDHPQALIGVAYCLAQAQKFDVAEARYRRLPESIRSRFDIRNNLAVCLHRQSKHAEALAELNQALAQAPQHPKLRMNRASVLSAMALQESTTLDAQAWDDARAALASEPASGSLYVVAASILGRLQPPPPQAADEMLHLLRGAVQHGIDYERFAADPHLTQWLTPHQIAELRTLQPMAGAKTFYDGLLPP